MAAKSFKDCVLDMMSTIDWPNVDASQQRDTAMGALADGIFEYLDNADNRTVICTATGALTVPPAAAVPYAGPATVELTWPPAATIKTQLLAQTVAIGDLSAIFLVLAALPIVSSITAWDPSSVGTLTGAGATVFAAMAAQGNAAKAQMLATKPATIEDAWGVMQTFVLLGLTAGVITVPACAGTVGSPTAIFAGAGAGTVTYR